MEYTEINEQYIELLYDYFDNFKKSSIHKNVFELTKYFYIGIHSYNRVFNYVLFKTNSLDKAIFYSKKSADKNILDESPCCVVLQWKGVAR